MEICEQGITADAKYNYGLAAFKQATEAIDFFSPLKQRRASKMKDQVSNGHKKGRKSTLIKAQSHKYNSGFGCQSIGKHLSNI